MEDNSWCGGRRKSFGFAARCADSLGLAYPVRRKPQDAGSWPLRAGPTGENVIAAL